MANNLARIRGKHQISQIELAKRLGVTKQCVCFAELHRCSLELARKVADLLKESVFDILGTDVFLIEPKTEDDKTKVIKLIKGDNRDVH